ncbi:MAG TPA: HlyD family efflux transporter periplasmic adaptor subunit [Rhizomicrobium sp.]|jgi:HlyD family secretion protein
MKRLSILLFLLLAACGKSDDQVWLGYGEGDNAFIAAPQPGWVSSLHVERGAYVHRGDLLFTLDDTAQIAARDQAVASLETAKASLTQEQANLLYSKRQLERQSGLARVNAGTPTNLDLAKSNYEQSAARIAQLQSQIQQMEASLSGATYSLTQRDVVSQTEGRVQDIYYRPGEYAPASTPVLSILPPKNIYVRFFVPEPQFSKVHIGQKVRVTCDGCRPMTAQISFIAQQQEFTPPVIFSENSRAKLVFKLEARMPGGMKLNPGQPVQVRPL